MTRLGLPTVRPVLILLCVLALVAPVRAQSGPDRDRTRELLRSTLAAAGPGIGVAFRQSDKNPYNFVGSYAGAALKNAQSFEIVISVTAQSTIGFRVYPHYNGRYINLQRASDGPALMDTLLSFTDRNFLFWGADETRDVFAGYTITLESGYPDEAVRIVLRSIRNLDPFVGALRPFVDGSAAVH